MKDGSDLIASVLALLVLPVLPPSRWPRRRPSRRPLRLLGTARARQIVPESTLRCCCSPRRPSSLRRGCPLSRGWGARRRVALGSDALAGVGDAGEYSARCNCQQKASFVAKAAIFGCGRKTRFFTQFLSSDASGRVQPSGRRPRWSGRLPGRPAGQPSKQKQWAGDAGRTPRRRAIGTRRFCSRRIARARAARIAAQPIAGAAPLTQRQPKQACHWPGGASARPSSMATRTCTRTPRRTRCCKT